MPQHLIADPGGFSTTRRARDQPGLLHDLGVTARSWAESGMGIILTMPGQMMLVSESSGYKVGLTPGALHCSTIESGQ